MKRSMNQRGWKNLLKVESSYNQQDPIYVHFKMQTEEIDERTFKKEGRLCEKELREKLRDRI